jgi:hypothetical protein
MESTPPPLVGFNNNVRYRGMRFHIQTEDSGITRPHIITHLFADGGYVIKSVRTDYSEYIDCPDRPVVIQRLMREQHRAMALDLRDGRLDATIDRLTPSQAPGASGAEEASDADGSTAAEARSAPDGSVAAEACSAPVSSMAAEACSAPVSSMAAEACSAPVSSMAAEACSAPECSTPQPASSFTPTPPPSKDAEAPLPPSEGQAPSRQSPRAHRHGPASRVGHRPRSPPNRAANRSSERRLRSPWTTSS